MPEQYLLWILLQLHVCPFSQRQYSFPSIHTHYLHCLLLKLLTWVLTTPFPRLVSEFLTSCRFSHPECEPSCHSVFNLFCFYHSRHFFWAITYLFGMALWIIFKSILQSKSLRFYFTSLVVYWTHILGCVIITITQSSLEPNCHFPCLFLHLLLSSLYLRVSRFKTLKSLLTSLLFYPSMCYQSLNSVHFLIYYLFRPFLSFHYLPGLGL